MEKCISWKKNYEQKSYMQNAWIIYEPCMVKLYFFTGCQSAVHSAITEDANLTTKNCLWLLKKKNLKTSHTSEMFVRILDIQYYTKRAQCHKSDAQLIATNCQTLKCVNFSLIYNWKTLISFFQVPKTKKKGKHLEEVPL